MEQLLDIAHHALRPLPHLRVKSQLLLVDAIEELALALCETADGVRCQPRLIKNITGTGCRQLELLRDESPL